MRPKELQGLRVTTDKQVFTNFIRPWAELVRITVLTYLQSLARLSCEEYAAFCLILRFFGEGLEASQ